jgi:hypothetical protein
MQTLSYTVQNSQLVTIVTPGTYEGRPVIMSYQRADIECIPLEAGGKTLSIVLPPEALADFPEGWIVDITVTAHAPAPVAGV